MAERKGRHPRESESVLTELMMPHYANIMGNVFGGHILALVDRVAAVAAIRHAHRECVTVSVDKVVPETPDEKRRYDRAAKRRAKRVMERRYEQGRGE